MIGTTRYSGSCGALVADVTGPEDGPLVVLAHGAGQTRHAWSKAQKALGEAGYFAVNYDMRGHGDSDWSPDNAYAPPDLWQDMRAIIETRPGPYAIIGASMGGITALCGLLDGAVPNATVLVDIAPNSDRAGMERVRSFMTTGLNGFATVEEAAEAVSSYNPHRPKPSRLAGLMKNLKRREDGRLYWHWDPGILDLEIDQERARMDDMLRRLKQMSLPPIQLIRGMKSDVVTDQAAAEMTQSIPDLTVVDIQDAGHMVAGDRNDAFNSAAISFIRAQMPA